MLRFSGSSQNPGSSVLDELQLSNGLLWKAGEETITIIINQLCLTVFSSLQSSLLLVHLFLPKFFLPVNFAFNML